MSTRGGGDGDNTMGEFVMDGSVQASSGKQPSVPLLALQRLYPDGKNRMVGSILSLSHTKLQTRFIILKIITTTL